VERGAGAPLAGMRPCNRPIACRPPALRVSPRSDPQRGPSSALRHARRGLVTQHGADSRRVFSQESAGQDTRQHSASQRLTGPTPARRSAHRSRLPSASQSFPLLRSGPDRLSRLRSRQILSEVAKSMHLEKTAAQTRKTPLLGWAEMLLARFDAG
jgi:hypothetical protein